MFHKIMFMFWWAGLLVGLITDSIDTSTMVFYAAMFLHEAIYIRTEEINHDKNY